MGQESRLSKDLVFLHLKKHAPKEDNDKQGKPIKNQHRLASAAKASASLVAAKIS